MCDCAPEVPERDYSEYGALPYIPCPVWPCHTVPNMCSCAIPVPCSCAIRPLPCLVQTLGAGVSLAGTAPWGRADTGGLPGLGGFEPPYGSTSRDRCCCPGGNAVLALPFPAQVRLCPSWGQKAHTEGTQGLSPSSTWGQADMGQADMGQRLPQCCTQKTQCRVVWPHLPPPKPHCHLHEAQQWPGGDSTQPCGASSIPAEPGQLIAQVPRRHRGDVGAVLPGRSCPAGASPGACPGPVPPPGTPGTPWALFCTRGL